MPFPTLTPTVAAEALRALGLPTAPEELDIEPRDDCWIARMPGDRLAWFAASPAGTIRLAKERHVLRLIEARCSFAAPRIVTESAVGDVDVRTMVPGLVDPWRMFKAVQSDPAVLAQTGRAIGRILAEQHSRIVAADVENRLPLQPSWPRSSEWVRERLPRVIDDPGLMADIEVVMARYEEVAPAAEDRALVHADVGFHNMAVDPKTLAVRGLFDYEDASWADRHHDFRYLVFDNERTDLLDAALEVYQPAVGRTLSRTRVLLYNAACAITFLAFRAGTGPEERPCGRTLAEDVRWTTQATARVLRGMG